MIRNLLYSFRSLRRSWVFSMVVILTLGLGIGANSAVIIFANTLLFHRLPYAHDDRVVNLWSSASGKVEPVMTVSPPDFQDWRQRSTSFSDMAAFNVAAGDVLGQGTPENVAGAIVSTNFFQVLGMPPVIGRMFDSRDEGHAVIILSYSLWQRDFGGAQSVLGQKIILGDKPYIVVGVMPQGFLHPEPLSDRAAEYWRPMPDFSSFSRGFRFLRVVGRLKPEVGVTTAAAEMKQISTQLAREFPETDGGRTALLVPLRDQMFGDLYRPLLLLFFAAGAVLVVACANVTNLQLARTNSRLQQLSIRMAIGAKLRQIISLVFSEALILAVLGAALGLLFGYLALHALRLVAPSNLHRLDLVTIDGRMLLLTCLMAVVSALVIGVPPALRVLRLKSNSGALQNAYLGTTPSRQRMQRLILVAQLALVLPLLVATSVLGRSLFNLLRVDTGFNPNRLLTLRIYLPQTRYAGPDAARAFFRDFLENAKNTPGIRSIALTSSVPFTPLNTESVVGIALQQGGSPSESQSALYRVVSEDYFQTMGIPLLSGRSFSSVDKQSSPRVVVVSAAFARESFPNQDPVGKPVFMSKGESPVAAMVVGVAGDVRSQSLSTPAVPEIYAPFAQDASLSMAAVARTTGPPEDVVTAIRGETAKIDKLLALRDVQSMDELLYSRTSASRFALLLMTLSSLLALALALIGVGGVVAYIVSERTREFGIRVAVGATHRDLMKSLFVHILRFAVAGVAIGLLLALAVKRIPENLIYGVGTVDPASFAGAGLILIVAVLLACYFPVRGILKIDPVNSLRMER